MKTLLRRHAGAFQLVFVIAVVGSAVLLSASLRPESTDVRAKSAEASGTAFALQESVRYRRSFAAGANPGERPAQGGQGQDHGRGF